MDKSTNMPFNRAEMRRQKKKSEKDNKTYNMTAAALETALEEAAKRASDKAIRKVIHQMNVAMAMVAHDKLGFGTTRLRRFLSDIMEIWDSIDREYISIAEIEKALFEETGVEIK